MRTTIIATVVATAIGVPGLAQAQNTTDYTLHGGLAGTPAWSPAYNEAWRRDELGSMAYVVSESNRAGLIVYCRGDRRFITMGGVSSHGIDDLREPSDRSSDLAQLHHTMAGGEIVVLDRGGRALASIPLRVERLEETEYSDAGHVMRTWLTPAQMAAIRGAHRLEARNGRWTIRFTGAGSTYATNFTDCPMGGF